MATPCRDMRTDDAGGGTIGLPYFGPEMEELCPGIQILSPGGTRCEWTVLVVYKG